MISLDANILFYSADKTAGARHRSALQLLQDAAGPGTALTEQALFEFFYSATRKGKVPVPDAMVIVRQFAKNFVLLHPHRTTLEDALNLYARYNLSIWDARLLSTCDAHGCTHLFSEDMQDGAQYGGVTVVNPFNPANIGLIAQLLTP